MDRRRFIQCAAGSVGLANVPSYARGPIDRAGRPNIQIGLAAYSFRSAFPFMKGKAQKHEEGARKVDMFGFIDYCAEHGIAGAELTSYFFPPTADKDYFLRLKQHAHIRGVTICGTAIGNNFSRGPGEEMDREIAAAKSWIDKAALFGAPHIRFFAGTARDLEEDPKNLDHAIAAIEECANHAAGKGIFIGIENHGNLSSDQVLAIMRGVNNPWVGVNLDTGNFISDDPYGDIAKCVPYAVNVQVKVSMRRPDRTKYPADMDRLARLLSEGNYQGFAVLEYEEEGAFENVPPTLTGLRKAFALAA